MYMRFLSDNGLLADEDPEISRKVYATLTPRARENQENMFYKELRRTARIQSYFLRDDLW